LATRRVTTIAGSPQIGGYADGRSALFRLPEGIWGDGASLFVADAGNGLIRQIDLASHVVTTVAKERLSLIGDIWGNGNVFYMSDFWNHKLRRAVPKPTSTNPADIAFRIALRGGLTRVTEGTDPAVRVGHARIIPDPGNNPPAGLAIFGLRQNGVLISEAAVPASVPILSGRIYAEVDGLVNTGVAISNPNSVSATISFYFTNSSGQTVNSGTTVIPANQQIANFLDQAPFTTSSSRPSFSDIRTFTFTANMPVSVIALRGFTNERSQFLITTLPVVPITGVANDALSFPHFADGGGWKTEVVLVNPTDVSIVGIVQFMSRGTPASAGQAITLTVNGNTSSSFSYSIPARGAVKLQTPNTDSLTRSGWVWVTPDTGQRTPSGVAVFSFRPEAVTVSEAGVQALTAGKAFRLYTEAQGDFNAGSPGSIQTGFAISNPSETNINVGMELINIDGSATSVSGNIAVPAQGQVAMFLNQLQGFSGLPNPFRGTLRIGSATPVNIVGLRARYNEVGNLLITTTPPVDETAPAVTSEMVFPHFVDGGGYTTEFILFGAFPTQTPNGSLRFFGQNGQGLNIQLR